MDALSHGNGVWAGAERAWVLSAGTVHFLTVNAVIKQMAVEHAHGIGHPPVRPMARLVVVCALDYSKHFGKTGRILVVSFLDGCPGDCGISRAGSEEEGN